ncbi:thermonuclease family protein [Dankookia rubra]|uniref:Thermonuclease family protein n=1 Tax=Dankookia rubra TaxID=1442381 RepID=A0A4R5QK43_9PROT|nr:thermonuclease family protein [Dankookia rubra]TDH63810.1 thermonuclease family protein [Dankookia rubra]
MRIRRIFRRSPAARLRTPMAIATMIGLSGLLLSAAVPRDLLGSAPPQPMLVAAAGEIRVLDGATLRLGDQVLQLQAVQVPARGQASCRDAAGRTMDCGAASAEALAGLVAGRDLACRIGGVDRHGRVLGTCEAGGVELGAALVAAGWALAADSATPGLATSEAIARQGGRGLWSAARPAAAAWRRGS